MKNICVVQGGGFLLGIPEQEIFGRTPWIEAVPQLRQDCGTVIQLSALLSRQPGCSPQPDAVCLKLRDSFLVVDQIAAEGAELINPPGPLPPACPRLAARLCPQVTILGRTPVLLMDPAQILPVAEELGDGVGVIAVPEENPAAAYEPAGSGAEGSLRAVHADDQAPAADEAAKTEESLAFLVEEEPASSSESTGAGPCGCPPPAPIPAEAAPAPAADDTQHKKDSAAIDEETFKKVMAWTVACFKRRKNGEELRLGIEELPPELAAMVRQKGLSSSIIQYLIDQIVLRCQESAGRRTTAGGSNED